MTEYSWFQENEKPGEKSSGLRELDMLFPVFYCGTHRTASPMTTKPVVVQHESFTSLLPPAMLNVPKAFHLPPLAC